MSQAFFQEAKNGKVQIQKEFSSTSHYSFAGYQSEGCSKQHLEKLIITIFDQPQGQDGVESTSTTSRPPGAV